ncbi:MAG: hypothetical protein AB1733_04045 [Thermodesulfobacteriota bacterium]
MATYSVNSFLLGRADLEPVSIQGRFETCHTMGWSVDLCGISTGAADVGAGVVSALGTHWGECLKTRDTPKIVARLSVDAWKGTLTPTLSQREREPEESLLSEAGERVRVRGRATIITDCRLLRHFLRGAPTLLVRRLAL